MGSALPLRRVGLRRAARGSACRKHQQRRILFRVAQVGHLLRPQLPAAFHRQEYSRLESRCRDQASPRSPCSPPPLAAILLLFLIRGIVLWIEVVGVGWAVASDLDNYGFSARLCEVVHT